MSKIEVCLSPKLFNAYSFKDKIVVVVDILRATSIITTMFQNGLKKLIPVKSLNEAKTYKKMGFLVAAERNGKKVVFADFGNSPFELTPQKIKNKTIVYSTTNGTNTINIVKKSDHVIIASFLNLSRIADYLKDQKKDVLILCSGWKGNYCIEDSLFAGALTEKLIDSNKFSTDCDSAIASNDLWKIAKVNLTGFIKKIYQYKRLRKMGMEDAANQCFNIDVSEALPVLKKNYLINLKNTK